MGEGVTILLEQLPQICCLLPKPGGKRTSLSPPRYINTPGGLACGMGKVVRQRLYRIGGLGEVLQQVKDPMHRETCVSSVPFFRHSTGFHDVEL